MRNWLRASKYINVWFVTIYTGQKSTDFDSLFAEQPRGSSAVTAKHATMFKAN